MSRAKTRLDTLIFSLGLVESRNVAQSLIIRGLVLVDDQPITKPGQLVKAESAIRIKEHGTRHVSRAGEKLEHALEHFSIEVSSCVCLDVGSSTGGFTDCLLSRGAEQVYAVDVGQNQLAYKLRVDPRVCLYEQTHASDITQDMFEQLPSIVVMDVSFISVRKILKQIIDVVSSDAKFIILVKPQFELEKKYISKGGVVKDEKHQLLAVELVDKYAQLNNLHSIGTVKSPILGAKKGNQEYLLALSKIA